MIDTVLHGGQKLAPGNPNHVRSANLIGRMALWCVTLTLLFAGLYACSSVAWLFLVDHPWFVFAHKIVLCGLLLSGICSFATLFILHRFLVPPYDTEFRPLGRAKVIVALTAFNDEESIGQSVREFKGCQEVDKVIVIDNNSGDRTCEVAKNAGADDVIVEMVPGYGSCCMRALEEASREGDVIVLCEGDMTFSANDVKKFLAYLENCDLVLGTRATQELRQTKTQMDWLINPANQIMAKLIQTRFWGVRLTDVGCTYRAIRADAYVQLKNQLHVRGNHFSPHMFIEALKLRFRVIEIPVVFRRRVGQSKGVGNNKLKAARVAVKMLGLLYCT